MRIQRDIVMPGIPVEYKVDGSYVITSFEGFAFIKNEELKEVKPIGQKISDLDSFIQEMFAVYHEYTGIEDPVVQLVEYPSGNIGILIHKTE